MFQNLGDNVFTGLIHHVKLATLEFYETIIDLIQTEVNTAYAEFYLRTTFAGGKFAQLTSFCIPKSMDRYPSRVLWLNIGGVLVSIFLIISDAFETHFVSQFPKQIYL